MNLDEFPETYVSVKDLKAAGVTATLCGVSDGRGKVCRRSCDGPWPDPDHGVVVARCPKHGAVVCSADEFLAAVHHQKQAVFFARGADADVVHRSEEG